MIFDEDGKIQLGSLTCLLCDEEVSIYGRCDIHLTIDGDWKMEFYEDGIEYKRNQDKVKEIVACAMYT
jgi:hypothetical protein